MSAFTQQLQLIDADATDADSDNADSSDADACYADVDGIPDICHRHHRQSPCQKFHPVSNNSELMLKMSVSHAFP